MVLKNNSFYKVAIIGSDECTLCSDKVLVYKEICKELGYELSKRNVILFSGGDMGIGFFVLESFTKNGGLSIVFCPEYKCKYDNLDNNIPLYTGLGYGIREIVMLRSADAVISLSGGAGTLGELANAYSLHLPIYTLEGTDGWTKTCSEKGFDIKKKTEIKVCKDCKSLVSILLKDLDKKNCIRSLLQNVSKK